MDDALFSERGAIELEWLLSQKKGGQRLGKLLLYAFFGQFGGRGIREPLKIVKVWMKHLKVPFFLYIFWDWIRLYIGDGTISLLEFVDWLGSPYGAVVFCVFAPYGFCCFVYIVYTFLIQFPFTYKKKGTRETSSATVLCFFPTKLPCQPGKSLTMKEEATSYQKERIINICVLAYSQRMRIR